MSIDLCWNWNMMKYIYLTIWVCSPLPLKINDCDKELACRSTFTFAAAACGSNFLCVGPPCSRLIGVLGGDCCGSNFKRFDADIFRCGVQHRYFFKLHCWSGHRWSGRRWCFSRCCFFELHWGCCSGWLCFLICRLAACVLHRCCVCIFAGQGLLWWCWCRFCGCIRRSLICLLCLIISLRAVIFCALQSAFLCRWVWLFQLQCCWERARSPNPVAHPQLKCWQDPERPALMAG